MKEKVNGGGGWFVEYMDGEYKEVCTVIYTSNTVRVCSAPHFAFAFEQVCFTNQRHRSLRY